MTRLPMVHFTVLERTVKNLGFEAVRRKGSHIFPRHPDGETTTAPNHPGRDLARPLTREILREIELTPDEFWRQLNDLWRKDRHTRRIA
jgi:predicted RNA binding protein YcfA (HicA-like mRNA interferase family)